VIGTPLSPWRFDWYQALLVGVYDPDYVAPHLLIGSGGLVLRQAHGGYRRPYSLSGKTPDGTVTIYYGGELEVFVVGTSAAAPHVAAVLRDRFPAHLVSRADPCIDFDEPGVFLRLYDALFDLAGGREGRKVKVSTVGDWPRGIDGRTFYAGTRLSQLMGRLYEKGIELAAKHPDQTFSRDLTRYECEVRPKGDGKRKAALASPEELAAWTPFGAAALAVLSGLQLDAQAPARPESTDPEYWMFRQYRETLQRLLLLQPEELYAHVAAGLARVPEPV
jgi:hypothetical protein